MNKKMQYLLPLIALAGVAADGHYETSRRLLAAATKEPTIKGIGLIFGAFNTVNTGSRSKIAEIGDAGLLTANVLPSVSGGDVLDASKLPDGSIIIVGSFTSVDSQARNRIAKINSDGSLNTSFNPNANAPVRVITSLYDGSMLVGGDFTQIAGASMGRFAKLNSDGTIHDGFKTNLNFYSAFGTGFPAWVSSIVVESNGMILVGGDFQRVSGPL